MASGTAHASECIALHCTARPGRVVTATCLALGDILSINNCQSLPSSSARDGTLSGWLCSTHLTGGGTQHSQTLALFAPNTALCVRPCASSSLIGTHPSVKQQQNSVINTWQHTVVQQPAPLKTVFSFSCHLRSSTTTRFKSLLYEQIKR